MNYIGIKSLLWSFIVLLLWPSSAFSQTVHVAVAANFKKPFLELAALFESQTKHQLLISSGSTGKLYAQIINGAPFELFLAADQKRPKLLVESGFALPKNRFAYAQGRLTLYNSKPRGSPIDKNYLKIENPPMIALSNPKVAPYGQRAKQVLQSLGLWRSFSQRMAFGENVGQTLAFIASGSIEAGFIAYSQVLTLNPDRNQYWIIPQKYYRPLLQDVVLLNPGQKNPAALALLAFLKAPETLKKIEKLGYGVP
jgi:molybdate transport system substrate-binding protein